MTTRDELFVELARTESAAESDDVRAHIRRARTLVGDLPLRQLAECPECGFLGLPERLAVHDCSG